MGTKAEELAKALKGEGCLGKAADDEPVFILRAKDKSASRMVRRWAAKAKDKGASEAKVQGALKIADDMDEWGKKNGNKFPT